MKNFNKNKKFKNSLKSEELKSREILFVNAESSVLKYDLKKICYKSVGIVSKRLNRKKIQGET